MPQKVIILSLISIFLLGINLSVFAQDEDITLPMDKIKEGPPKLESILYELTQAEDYTEFAETNGLDIVDNKVRVILGLWDTVETTDIAADYDLPQEFGIEERRVYNEGTYIKALIYIDKLLDLAEVQDIAFIRQPFTPVAEISTQNEGDKGIPIYIYYLGGIGILVILFLVYYFLKKVIKKV